jgi:hypothetical protein
MLVLTMASARSRHIPTILLQFPKQVTHFHAVSAPCPPPSSGPASSSALPTPPIVMPVSITDPDDAYDFFAICLSVNTFLTRLDRVGSQLLYAVEAVSQRTPRILLLVLGAIRLRIVGRSPM